MAFYLVLTFNRRVAKTLFIIQEQGQAGHCYHCCWTITVIVRAVGGMVRVCVNSTVASFGYPHLVSWEGTLSPAYPPAPRPPTLQINNGSPCPPPPQAQPPHGGHCHL